jgi:subtilisin family serine protease
MSTEDQNKAVVTLKKGVDVDAFIEDMVSGSNHNEFMPGRRVELYNEKPDSLRNVDFVLTYEEAMTLRNDPRIVDVRFGTKKENGIILKPTVLEESKVYSKTSTLNNTHYNWAFPACTRSTNPFSTTTINFNHAYTLSGDGVDVVIQDSGILTTHPEWLDLAGETSRFQQVDWPTISGLTGTYTQDPNHYTDPEGHGTHVAGTVAGRLYGWAKKSNIYAIAMVDNPAGFGVSASFNMIRAWHELKSVQANGYKRTTVVNMSWGYFSQYVNINGGTYRGTPWSGTTMNSNFGLVQTIFNRTGAVAPFIYIHPARVASVDADIEDCIDAGVVLIGAAGNEAHKIDVPGGIDYDNFYNRTDFPGEPQYYHRGSTPAASTGVVCVGSVKIAQPEGKSFFSNTGPRLNTFAPGEAIPSAVPAGSVEATRNSFMLYPIDSNFIATKISGTSMASPQVAGVIACMMEARPYFTPSDVYSWIEEVSFLNRLTDSGGGYTDTSSLQSAANKFLNQPFNRSDVFSIKKT